MKSLIGFFVLMISACAPLAPQPTPTAGGIGKPCPDGIGTCFPGGHYPASHLSEGGNPDKGTDGI